MTRLSTGITKYIVNVVQQINISNIANRITSLFRILSAGMQFLIDLVSGVERAGSAPPSGGGGGGGGGGSAVIEKSVLEITPDKFTVSLKQGTNTKKNLLIKNIGDTTKKIKLESFNIDKFVRITETDFDLKAGESRSVEIEFIVGEEIKPDLYLGKIVIKADSVEKEVLVALDVSSKKSLLDVKAEILNLDSRIVPGEKLITKIQLFNFGLRERVDVKMEYTIRDSSNEIILSEEETIAVETQTSFIKEFKIPSNLKPGTYILYVRAIYSDGASDTIASSSAWFVVEEASYINIYIILAIISFIFLVIIAIKYIKIKIRNKHKFIEGNRVNAKDLIIYKNPILGRLS